MKQPKPPPSLLDVELVRAVRRVVGPAPRPADYVEALQLFAEPLSAIPLPVQCDVDTAQAFRDASREEIMLNGVRFVGDHRIEAFVAAVKRIVGAHVGGDEHPDRALLVADRIMRGCSRTLSGADSFFATHELFASPEVLVTSLTSSVVAVYRAHVGRPNGCIAFRALWAGPPKLQRKIKPRGDAAVPLDVTLGRDFQDHRFKCRIKCVNLFGLYANEDIERLLRSDRQELDPPLVAMDAIIVERIDLTADKSSRRLTIRSPDCNKTPTKFDLELRELF
ncbi:Lysophospholipid acyltransferase [Phytophthora nicotianae]|uniref:Lysophospholipid acyltransferase n=1 Tax=Phytophthora nicotianae TaxID=4792 RepID=A0A0W8DTJ0_PHYNI|nr:Lysophospholipid acyltransferase [Phytophthora nicotianae]